MKKSIAKIRFLFISFSFSVISPLYAANIDTLSTLSKIMDKEILALVVTPDNYNPNQKLPVVYLLHGYGNSSLKGWVTPETKVDHYADIYNLILVIPDGGSK